MATFESSLKSKLIYVFAINDERHLGALKIGETTLEEDNGEELFPNCEPYNQAAHKRIRQYTQTAGIAYDLLYTCSALFNWSGTTYAISDKQIHKVLDNSGVEKKKFEGVKGADEWYCCDLETIKKAIKAAKKRESSLHPSDVTKEQNPVILRPEQRAAVDKTRKRFKKYGNMLWNAKMRFGKTISALQLIKEEGYGRVLILTHRPVVDKGWFDDYQLIFYDSPQYRYFSKTKIEDFGEIKRHEDKGGKYIYFASMQDLRGSEIVGGKFDKNDLIFSTVWDLVIVDEAHEGTKTELGQNVLKEVRKENTKVLQLSGTPFNLFDDYTEEEIYTWDYVMEQKAKQAWYTDNPYEPNPYTSLPAINIYTYDLGNLMSEFMEDEKAFNFREFFRTKDDDTFVHDADVDRFLNLLCKNDKESLYPYSNDKFRRIFRHTLWLVPGVKAARSLSTKLQQHPVFGMFKVVNVAGNGDEDEENAEALKMVEKAIGKDPDETYTITLSCGRLTTGVSVKPWTGVFMMAGSFSTSAAQYMQTIFRVQTPYENHGRMKEQCYAFDFAPDRTLRVLAETAKVSAKAGKQTEEDRRILGDFLNFCPIISIAGSQMKPYDVNKMMAQLKKAQIEKVVQGGFEDKLLYNDELLKLSEIDLEKFKKLKGIIGSTKAMAKSGDIDVNNQGFTQEEYEEKERLEKKKKKELTPEEKARLEELKKKKNQQNEAASILRGISIRMPLLIYGADLANEDEELTIDNFSNLVDDVSWEEFMPKGVTKDVFEDFKKYYEADVFREAGKRIRAMARTADKFTIEERIERISTIFNTFRNPDKETVLTPWRVVNMHMSDCLGGWCFYDEEFKQTLDIPRYVSQGRVTKDVFRPEAHILEINSKSGLYPLYVAYNIYRSRVEAAKEKYGEVSHGFAMSLWDATIEENILVVCKTPMARSITKRTLAGFRNMRVNVQYYKDLIKNISERPELVVNTFRDGKHFWKINDNTNMKLDAIVGNPPYQENISSNDSNRALSKQLFPLFVKIASEISPSYISLITPSRWFKGDAQDKSFIYLREYIKDHNEVRKIVHYPKGNEIFDSVVIKGGVSYYLTIKGYKGNVEFVNCINGKRIIQNRKLFEEDLDIILESSTEYAIIQKVITKDFISLMEITKGRNAFGIIGRPDIIEKISKSKPFEGSAKLRCKGNVIRWTSKTEISKSLEVLDKYKVFISKSAGDPSNDMKIIGKAYFAGPGEVCTDSLIPIGAFTTQEEAYNLQKYFATKFLRYLVSILKVSQNVTQIVYRFVPLQDFTNSSDINWTLSIEEIDRELYKKYNLTDEEIQIIESMIKPME